MDNNYEQATPRGLAVDSKMNSIDNNFRYHKPGEEIERKHERVREMYRAVAHEMNQLLPSGREARVVQTKLEEAMFWANAAIARNQR